MTRVPRECTADDVADLIRRVGRPLSLETILSGVAMGDGQLNIPAALNAAVERGLVRRSHTEPSGSKVMPHEFFDVVSDGDA